MGFLNIGAGNNVRSPENLYILLTSESIVSLLNRAYDLVLSSPNPYCLWTKTLTSFPVPTLVLEEALGGLCLMMRAIKKRSEVSAGLPQT